MLAHKIVSGGQTGVDQGALLAAMDLGLEIGGWCPPGRYCESGIIPGQFPLLETPLERSEIAPNIPRSLRTEWNVRDADGTLVIEPYDKEHSDPGTQWTKEFCKRMNKPLLVIYADDENCIPRIKTWMAYFTINILNVAGPSQSCWPDAENIARMIVYQALV